MGVKTVFSTVYPSETQDLTPIVQKYVGGQARPGVRRHAVRGRLLAGQGAGPANYNPKYLFFANGANSPVEFPDKVGAANTAGIMSCSAWFPTSKTPGNADVRLRLPEEVRRHA